MNPTVALILVSVCLAVARALALLVSARYVKELGERERELESLNAVLRYIDAAQAARERLRAELARDPAAVMRPDRYTRNE